MSKVRVCSVDDDLRKLRQEFHLGFFWLKL
jgi:hypothetical protein